MASHNGDDYTPVEGIVRISRHLSRQEILNEKRLRNTDMLPPIESDTPQSMGNARQANQLRDENRRLRRELEFLQRRLAQQRETVQQLDQEIETIHHGHQLEIEQYQSNLREMMEELNQKRDMLQESERKFQELEHSFHASVEEEASKMVVEAAQTMEFSPGHIPPVLHDAVKTLEFQVKQVGEQHVAQVTAWMQQMQRKNEQLELELARERESIAQEHQRLAIQQSNIRAQATARQKYIEAGLRARFIGLVAIVSTAILVACVFIQLILFEYVAIPLYWALFSPIFLCALLAYMLSRTGYQFGQGKKKQTQQQKKAT
jgi:hypothetical protein